MRVRLVRAVFIAGLAGSTAFPCSVPEVASPQTIVREADLIVRVRASNYAVEPQKRPKDDWLMPGTVRFEVLEYIKGITSAGTLEFPGHLRKTDDFNGRAVPYKLVRPDGLRGSCFATSYRRGAEFLFLIKTVDGAHHLAWAALAPTNEQLRSARDPWLAWVRQEVATARSEQP